MEIFRNVLKKADSLGNFGGQRFDAELDTEQGLVKVRFLVSEQTGMEWHSWQNRLANYSN